MKGKRFTEEPILRILHKADSEGSVADTAEQSAKIVDVIPAMVIVAKQS